MAVSRASLFSIEAHAYQPHPLHDAQRVWPESNCYVDLWIEVLHTLRLDPHACLAFTLCTDFEGDQFTFFKPPPGDLRLLYGIEVQELSIYRGLADQFVEQVAHHRLVMPEADAFFLPDTRGTDYRSQHSKTTIAVETIDSARKQLGYFHNGGYYTLEGEDFDGLFRIDRSLPPQALPPYTEIAKLDQIKRLPERELVARAVELLRMHLMRRPRENPLLRYLERFGEQLIWVLEGQPAVFHALAFVSMRQLGASFELAGAFIRWLAGRGELGLEMAALACESIATSAKALLLKTARASNHKRLFDPEPLIAEMAKSWNAAMEILLPRFGEG